MNMDQKLIYFAHPINTYKTSLEQKLLNLLAARWKDDIIVNPADRKHEVVVQKLKENNPDANVMGYFVDLVKSCDAVVVLPFGDGKWGAGVYKEAEAVLNLQNGKWVWVIDPITYDIRFVPKLNPKLCLSVEETRSRVRNPDKSIRQYS